MFLAGGSEEDEGEDDEGGAGEEEGGSGFGEDDALEPGGQGVDGFGLELGFEDFFGLGAELLAGGVREDGVRGLGFAVESGGAEPPEDGRLAFDEGDAGVVLVRQVADFFVLGGQFLKAGAVVIIIVQFRVGQDGQHDRQRPGQEKHREQQETNC